MRAKRRRSAAPSSLAGSDRGQAEAEWAASLRALTRVSRGGPGLLVLFQSDQLGSASTVSTWQRFAATWGISCLSGRRTARVLASRGAAGGCLAPSWHGFLAGATQLPSSPLILHQRVGSSAQKPGPGGDLSDKKALHFFVTVQDNRFTNSSNLRRLQSGKRHILHLIKL